MKISKKLWLLAILILVCGCNEYEKIMGPVVKMKMEDKTSNPIFDGIAEPDMPNMDLNNKTVLGIDSNNNQIRDDIDIWINRTFENYNDRMAIRHKVNSLRELMIVGEKINNLYLKGPIRVTVESEAMYARHLGGEVQRAIELVADSAQCMSAIFKGKELQKDFEKKYTNPLNVLFINTDLRKKVKEAFYSYNHVYKVTQYKKSNYDYCNFKVENVEMLKAEHEMMLKEQK